MTTDNTTGADATQDGDNDEADTQRLMELGQLLAGISHESRNILTAILSFAQVGQRRLSDPTKVASILKLIESETLRCIELHTTVLGHAATATSSMAGESAKPRPARLTDVLTSAARLVEHQLGMKHIQLQTGEVDSELVVARDATLLTQVFLNLLLNAMQATPENGIIRMKVTEGTDASVLVIVEDSGPGVPIEYRDKIFKRMFTTKAAGSGLGLAISHEIVQGIGGTIVVAESALGGAAFKVTIPRITDKVEA